MLLVDLFEDIHLKNLKYSKQEQYELIQKSTWNIAKISNPSEYLQLMAIREDGTALQWINNPTDRVKKIAKTINENL